MGVQANIESNAFGVYICVESKFDIALDPSEQEIGKIQV